MRHGKAVGELILGYRAAAVGAGQAIRRKTTNASTDCTPITRSFARRKKVEEEILNLISDENAHVRLWAAGHSLHWAPKLHGRLWKPSAKVGGPARSQRNGR